ncbi:filament-like plant protein 7 isoform X1 [Tanacetum coccineum]
MKILTPSLYDGERSTHWIPVTYVTGGGALNVIPPYVELGGTVRSRWEKAETEVLTLKQKLENATQQRVADEEILRGADAAFKECMMQLLFVREEQKKGLMMM